MTKKSRKKRENPLKSLVKDINDRGTDDMAVVEKRIKAGRTVTVLPDGEERTEGEKKERDDTGAEGRKSQAGNTDAGMADGREF